MYDFGDVARLTPLIKMFSIGHEFIPDPIHAGGLRYHGSAPTLALLKYHNIVKSIAYNQRETFEAAVLFANLEGIVPAPESAPALKAAIDYAIDAKRKNESKVILFNFSGEGLFYLTAYNVFPACKLPPFKFSLVKINRYIYKDKQKDGEIMHS